MFALPTIETLPIVKLARLPVTPICWSATCTSPVSALTLLPVTDKLASAVIVGSLVLMLNLLPVTPNTNCGGLTVPVSISKALPVTLVVAPAFGMTSPVTSLILLPVTPTVKSATATLPTVILIRFPVTDRLASATIVTVFVLTFNLLPVGSANALGLNPGSANGAPANEVPPKNIILSLKGSSGVVWWNPLPPSKNYIIV